MSYTKIDWNKIRQSLQKTRQIIDSSGALSSDQISRELHRRALELSIKNTDSLSSLDSLRIVEFKLGEEHYGIESSYISGAYETNKIINLPCTPKFLEGIINIHGKIICVVNLKEFFQIPATPVSSLYQVIVVNNSKSEFGILVDTVVSIKIINKKFLQTSLPTITATKAEFLSGIARDQLIILDANKLLTCKDLVIDQQP